MPEAGRIKPELLGADGLDEEASDWPLEAWRLASASCFCDAPLRL
ncbi:hypothetical protein PO124_29730 [Bacillus licheniformis]|nr:hypothetical protein [Bacillus licheniformis]